GEVDEMAQRRAEAATDKDQQIAHRSNFHVNEVNPANRLCRMAAISARDRNRTRPTKKGGSRSHRPSNFYSAVIPRQPAGLSPESISRQSMRPDGFRAWSF